MPKQKTHKGLSKRVKITATGKINRKRAGGGHLMSKKNSKRRHRISATTTMTTACTQNTRTGLCK